MSPSGVIGLAFRALERHTMKTYFRCFHAVVAKNPKLMSGITGRFEGFQAYMPYQYYLEGKLGNWYALLSPYICVYPSNIMNTNILGHEEIIISSEFCILKKD